MTSIIVADTQKRLDFSLPKMKQNQDIFLWVVFSAIGLEHEVFLTGKGQFLRHGSKIERDELLKDLSSKLAANSIIDGYIPWLANRMSRVNDLNPKSNLTDKLIREFRSVCIWAKETKTDLNKLSLEEALEQSKGYVPNAARKGKEDSDANPVVYTFADGHKVVQLKTDEALKREGDVMKHCVGTYCDAVKTGDSVIYSLRTPANKPLVTMELNPKTNEFEQTFGVENSDPTPEDAKYLIEFIKTKWPHDAVTLFKLGEDMSGLDKDQLKSLSPKGKSFIARKGSVASPAMLETIASFYLEATDDRLVWDREVIRTLASNEKTPSHVLEQIFNSSTARKTESGVDLHPTQPDVASNLWLGLAANKSTPAHILEELCSPSFVKKLGNPILVTSGILSRVIGNPNATSSVLEFVINTYANNSIVGTDVTQKMARRLDITEEMQMALAESPDQKTRYNLAENAKAVPEVLVMLATDPTGFVRRAVASNPSTPLNILRTLVGDKNRQVVEEVAENPSSTSDILEAVWASDGMAEVGVRERVAKHPNTPLPVLEKLAKVESNSDVLIALIKNPHSTVEMVEKLTTAKSLIVSKEAKLELFRRAGEVKASMTKTDKKLITKRLRKKTLVPATEPAITYRDPNLDQVYFQSDSGDQIFRGYKAYRQTSAAYSESLSDINLSGKNLSDTDFVNLDMTGAKFVDATLTGAKFDESDLTNANFSEADLRNSSFVKSILTGADFTGTDLRGADFTEAQIEGARFAGSRFNTTTKWPDGTPPGKAEKGVPPPPKEEVEIIDEEPDDTISITDEDIESEEEDRGPNPPGPFADAGDDPDVEIEDIDDSMEQLVTMISKEAQMSKEEATGWAEKVRNRLEMGETIKEAYSSFLGLVLDEQVTEFKELVQTKLKVSNSEAEKLATKYLSLLQQGDDLEDIVKQIVKDDPKRFKSQSRLLKFGNMARKVSETLDNNRED